MILVLGQVSYWRGEIPPEGKGDGGGLSREVVAEACGQ